MSNVPLNFDEFPVKRAFFLQKRVSYANKNNN